MKKLTLNITEKLEFRREIDVLIPEDMSKGQLERLLNTAEQIGSTDRIDSFIGYLNRHGITNPEGYDTDYQSPDSIEMECTDYTAKN